MTPDESYNLSVVDLRKRHVMRHIKERQKYIDELGEEAGKKAFFDSIKDFKYGTNGCMEWGEKIFNQLVSDMKRILSNQK